MPEDRLHHHQPTPEIALRAPAPDAAEAAVRVASSKRLGPRKRLGLLLYLEGVPVRRCAMLVGLRDYAALFRVAARYGLREIHLRRRWRLTARPRLWEDGGDLRTTET